MPAPGPAAAFATVDLKTRHIPAGRIFSRINKAAFPDPLGFGYNPTRFSDPQVIDPGKRFGVVYLGSALDVCFLEVILRDQRNGVVGDYPLEMTEFTSRTYASIATVEPLRLIDLTGDRKVQMGIPTDVTNASDQTLGRLWSEAIYLHPVQIDGIAYQSRLSRKINLAVFDRAVTKLRCARVMPLLQANELPAVLRKFRIAIAA